MGRHVGRYEPIKDMKQECCIKFINNFQAYTSKEYYKYLCLLGTKNDLQLYNKSTRGSLRSSQPSEAEIIS